MLKLVSHFLLTSTLLSSLCLAQLDQVTMESHLTNGANLLGTFTATNDLLANWMADVDDETPYEALSIPGTHDSLTWSQSDGLLSDFVRTQDLSLFAQLDNGVRFLDIRIGLVGNAIRLFHSSEQLDDTAVLEDIFWGLYHWLDAHPTESIIVMIKVDHGDNSAELQQAVRDLITIGPEADYWMQQNTFPTLGLARRKLMLVRRQSWTEIQNVPLVGVNLSLGWQDNDANIEIDYLGTGAKIVRVQDLYDVDENTTDDAVARKYEVFTSHIEDAVQADPGTLYITFASGFSTLVSPKMLATGENPGIISDDVGMNEKAVDFLATKQGQRMGIVVFDFFGSDNRIGAVAIGSAELASTITEKPNPIKHVDSGSGRTSVTSLSLVMVGFLMSCAML